MGKEKMNLRIIKVILLVIILVVLIITIILVTKNGLKKDLEMEIFRISPEEAYLYIPEEGCVADIETAKKIAEAVLISIYGERLINLDKPFRAKLFDDSVWVVVGSFPYVDTTKSVLTGSTVYIEIQKKDGKILGLTDNY